METQTINGMGPIPFDLPVNPDLMFSNFKNIYKKRIEKQQINLLKKIPFIKGFLNEGENILLVTTGCSPASFFEQYLTGFIIYYLKRSLFVFTNKRLFHIPTKKNYSYRNSIAQILYSDCQSLKIKGRKLIAQYKNGKTDKFFYIRSKEKKKIKALLSTISFEGGPSKTKGRVHLCPSCRNELEEGVFACGSCRLEFKNKDKARKISIIYPGGGYFYTRHPFLGVCDAVVETILLVLVIVFFIDVISGVEESGFSFIIFAIALIIEKLITIYHSNHFIKEFIPKEKDIKTIS